MKITFEELPARIYELNEKIDLLLDAVNSMNIQDEPESWMTLESLVEYLGTPGKPVPKSTVYGWVRINEIPHSKKGKRLYFSKKQIDKWLEEEGR